MKDKGRQLNREKARIEINKEGDGGKET